MIFCRVFFVIVFVALLSLPEHCFALASAFGAGRARTALVIGNGDYRTAPLKNPVNDARDMAAVLRKQGFEVIYRENADRSQMRSAIRKFEETLAKKRGTGLFYYAGHGVQLQGQNYLVPVEADIQREYEVPDETILAELVLKAMAYAENELNIVILDACRNNPFPRSFRSATRGLARMKTMGSGMLIAYATAPGDVAFDGTGENGIYTKHLLQAINTPGLSIEQIFKAVRQNVMAETNNGQTPWEESSLTGDFYFIATDNARISVQQPSQQVHFPAAPRNTKELMLWQGISTSRNPGDYREYLHRYPDGVFAELARSRIESLAQSTSPPAEVGSKRTEEPRKGATATGSGFAEKLQGTWKLDYHENNKDNYLQFTFAAEGRGSAEGEEPDGTWWAEPISWSLDGQVLALQYHEGEKEKLKIEALADSRLRLLAIQGENAGEKFTMHKVRESSLQLRTNDAALVGSWKDSWEADGKKAYQTFTFKKDGTALEQGEEAGDKWSDKGRWRVEESNILVITYEEDSQRYRIAHVTPDYLDLIDLSPEYMGQGSRLTRVGAEN